MAEGSSVDLTSIDDSCSEEKLDGLNLTSEILKEDEAYNSWDSFLEDSIDKRAAKALHISSCKELLETSPNQKQLTRGRPSSRTDSLINVIMTSMAMDMRKAACSVSPSPHRSSRTTSRGSTSAASTSASTSTSKTDKLIHHHEELENDEKHLSEEMQHVCNLQLPSDDSLVSEPELDLAFNQRRQTMDILSAAGNFHERRGVHGGYGTPSSYASEQEMKLYFDSITPNFDTEAFSNDSFDLVQNDHAESGLHAIALMEEKMKNEIMSTGTEVSEKQDSTSLIFPENSKPSNEETSKSDDKPIKTESTEKHEHCKVSEKSNLDRTRPDTLSKASRSKPTKKPSKFDASTLLLRRNSDGTTGTRNFKRNRQAKPKLDAKTRLSKMLKRASDSLIDSDISEAVVINLTTPDFSQVRFSSDELEPFESFQKSLKEFHSLDSNSVTSKSCDDYISEDYSSRSDGSFHQCSTDKAEHSIQNDYFESSKTMEESSAYEDKEEFINESLARTYQSPLVHDFDPSLESESSDFSSLNAKAFSPDSLEQGDTVTGDNENFRPSEEEKEDLSLDLSGLDDSESSDNEDLTPLLLQECTEAMEQQLRLESPIYFERDNDRLDEVCTARQQFDKASLNPPNGENLYENESDLDAGNASHEVEISKPKQVLPPELCPEEHRVEYYEHSQTNTNSQDETRSGKIEERDTFSSCVLDSTFTRDTEDASLKELPLQNNIICQLANNLLGNEDNIETITNQNKADDPPEKLPTPKEDLINTFANALAGEMLRNIHLNKKDCDLASCCDSGTESGYCTTTESRFKMPCEEKVLVKTDSQQRIESIPNSIEVCFCLQADQKHEAKPNCTAKSVAGAQQSSQVKTSFKPEIVLDKPSLKKFEFTVFEAKASAFDSCLKSYEELEPKLAKTSQGNKDSPTAFELNHDQLVDVAKTEVNKIISECLSSLQNENIKSIFEKSNQQTGGGNADRLSAQNGTSSKFDVSAADNTSDFYPDISSNKEKEKLVTLATAHSDSSLGHHQSYKEPKEQIHFHEQKSRKTSTLPKILVTRPSLDISDDLTPDTSPSKKTLNADSTMFQGSMFADFASERSCSEKSLPEVTKERKPSHRVKKEKQKSAAVNPHKTVTFSRLQNESPKHSFITNSQKQRKQENIQKQDHHKNIDSSEKTSSSIPDKIFSAAPNNLKLNEDEMLSIKVPTQEEFAMNLKSQYKDLDERISRILNPTPSPPPDTSPSIAEVCDLEDLWPTHGDTANFKPVRFQSNNPYQSRTHHKLKPTEIFQKSSSSYCSSVEKHPTTSSPTTSFRNHKQAYQTMSEDFQSISDTLQFIKENLNRNDESVKRLESSIRESWVRILALDEESASTSGVIQMSPSKRGEESGPTKVRALEEVVGLLKKHIQQRESEINGLGNRLRQSNEKIKELEQKLKGRNSVIPQDRTTLNTELEIFQKERNILQKQLKERIIEKEDAKVATRKARRDLDLEKEKQSLHHKYLASPDVHRPRNKELRERVDDLEFLNKPSEFDRPEFDIDSVNRETRSLRAQNDQSLLDLKTDNLIMREKLDRMNEISTENLLLQSDAADCQAELADLRAEAKHLRTKCYELTEDNRQCKAEIRDLRRYIELLKANKSGDSRQDLLSKIEYYQMEHDRLMDEIRGLKQRLGEVSPRSPRQRSPSPPRQRSPSPNLNGFASYPGPSTKSRSSPHSHHTVKFSKSLERGRSPVSDAMAASTASSLAAVRLNKERSLSPSAALNIRDLTMERYNQHMNGRESPHSIDSDSTEFLLKPHSSNQPASSSGISGSYLPPPPPPTGGQSDDEDIDYDIRHRSGTKLSDSFGSNHGGLRISSRDNAGCSPCKRSCSPSSTGGFRSISPRMTSTQNEIPDTARDRYPTKIKRSLPRRAFAPRSPADLKLGYCIKFTRPGGRLSRGTVKYIGHLPTRHEIFIGVEMDGHDGKHSGTFQGTKYFTCPSNKGIFTPFSKVIMAWE